MRTLTPPLAIAFNCGLLFGLTSPRGRQAHRVRTIHVIDAGADDQLLYGKAHCGATTLVLLENYTACSAFPTCKKHCARCHP